MRKFLVYPLSACAALLVVFALTATLAAAIPDTQFKGEIIKTPEYETILMNEPYSDPPEATVVTYCPIARPVVIGLHDPSEMVEYLGSLEE